MISKFWPFEIDVSLNRGDTRIIGGNSASLGVCNLVLLQIYYFHLFYATIVYDFSNPRL